MKIGLIGVGYWGPNYAQNFINMKGVEFVGAFDLRRDNVVKLQNHLNTKGIFLQVFDSQQHLIDVCDAVIVATPASTHYQIVRGCLIAGKHVLCEKMLTLNWQEHKELSAMAQAHKLVLLPGYTYLHNEAIQKIEQIIQSGRLGKPIYATATRTNYGPMRDDVNALQDLAAHDLSVFIKLFSQRDLNDYRILNKSLMHVRGLATKADAGNLTLLVNASGESPVHCSINVSWHEPGKCRKMIVNFERGKIEFDDTAWYLLKEYESQGDPSVGVKEYLCQAEVVPPLTRQCEFFVDAVRGRYIHESGYLCQSPKADLHLHISEVVTAILE